MTVLIGAAILGVIGLIGALIYYWFYREEDPIERRIVDREEIIPINRRYPGDQGVLVPRGYQGTFGLRRSGSSDDSSSGGSDD